MRLHCHTLHLLTSVLLLLAVAAPGLAAPAEDEPAPPAPAVDLPGDEAPPEGDGLLVLDPGGENQCIQVTVWALNPETGECREFGSPCSVPSGWEIHWFDPTCGAG